MTLCLVNENQRTRRCLTTRVTNSTLNAAIRGLFMTLRDKATTPLPDATHGAGKLEVTPHAAGPLVINLCSSNTPMSLLRPDAPELARFTFFVSRRREEGRERFRLHMGYFATRAEAEQLLVVVREVYPAAWVGDAPGQNLRPQARATQVAAPPAPHLAAAPPLVSVRTPPSKQTTLVAKPAPMAAKPTPVAARPTPVVSKAAAIAPKPVPAATRPTAAAPPARSAPAVAARQSNVREVLAQLGTSASATRPAANPGAANASTANSGAPGARAARPPVRVPTREELDYELLHGNAEASDSQVLRVLESRVTPPSPASPARRPGALTPEARNIPVQRPQDTMTWREIRQELAREASVSFALQLVWSPNPVDARTVPPLAIFDAYTLYNVEITRPEGKQYGLRLGFFSDAMSAKQVATYVRSDFLAVAVVPVTLGERDQAQKSGGIQVSRPVARTGTSLHAEEITLINDLTPPRARIVGGLPMVHKLANAGGAAAAPGKNTVVAAQAVRPSRPRGGGPRTLEETLEILGASQLSIDNGKGERLNIGSRGRSAPDRRTSTFSKLLDRLSTRLKP